MAVHVAGRARSGVRAGLSVGLRWLACAAAFGVPGCASPEPVLQTGTTASGLYYEVSGTGEPVVLIHGFSLDRRMWGPQITALQSSHRVIRYDLRGHGRSADITGPYAGRDDLAEVLDTLGVGAAMLVGLSAGAQIAVDFALVHPDRVTKLVLASPGLSGYVAKEPFDWMMPVFGAASAGNVEEASALWAGTRMMEIPTNPAGDSLMRLIVMENAKIWSYRSNPELPMVPPAIGRLSEIGVPTLIVVGERDLVDIGRTADTLAACIGRSEKRTVGLAGHMVNLASPDEFTTVVREFLDRPVVRVEASAQARCRA